MTTVARNAYLVCITLLFCVACSAPAESTSASGGTLDEAFERGTLTITADDGKQHIFDVYLATTRDQQQRGLMFVRKLPASTGMLFIYEDADIHSMWMKNTYISLDMVFARADGSVSSVIHDTQPLSLTPQGSLEPVNYVLELNAGITRRLNIGQNSHISLAARNRDNNP